MSIWCLIFMLLGVCSPCSGFVKSLLKPSPMLDSYSDVWSRPKFSNHLAVYQNLTLTHVQTLEGGIVNIDLQGKESSQVLKGDYLWPNELGSFVDKQGDPVMLVPDGFLMPGQSDGGLYAIKNPYDAGATPVRITNKKPDWFYHRAVHVRLPGGMEGVITARARKSLFGRGQGELVWLTVPDSIENTPWEETIIAQGPDVMFEVIDLNPGDMTVEVIAAHFFEKKLTIHSIRGIPAASGRTGIEFCKVKEIPTEGRPYGLCLAPLLPSSPSSSSPSPSSSVKKSASSLASDTQTAGDVSTSLLDSQVTEVACDRGLSTHLLVSTHECSYDIPAALRMGASAIMGQFPRVRTGTRPGTGLRKGDEVSAETGPGSTPYEDGGALFAYALPDAEAWEAGEGMDGGTHVRVGVPAGGRDFHVRVPWERHTMFRGFKVRGWGGIFSPGAPGFPYVFKMPHKPQTPPLILLAGDCTGSAYIFSPLKKDMVEDGEMSAAGQLPDYELAFEVECGATVGSACVAAAADGSGDVDVYVPSYELNQLHAYRLSDQGSHEVEGNVDETDL